ncbi:MAG TPA: hypothetical protein VKA09_02505 [Nitrososphaeraceae archaeon]|nr:hypothetical protein [Nitrososphaeraceae archaeon]
MSKIYVKTKNSKNRNVMQSDITAGFAVGTIVTGPLQRNAEEHQAGGLEIVRIQ